MTAAGAATIPTTSNTAQPLSPPAEEGPQLSTGVGTRENTSKRGTVPLGAYVEPELKASLEELAHLHQRSLSGELRAALTLWKTVHDLQTERTIP